MEWTVIIMLIFVLMICLYYWLTSTFDFWSSRGVAGPSPKLFFGNLFDVALGKLSLAEYLKIQYDAHWDEKMFGVFLRNDPSLVITDPDLIRDVLIKDFSKFPYRGVKTFYKISPLTQNLFNLEPAQWRPLRNKLAPAFASVKLKKMFYLLLECGEQLEAYLEKLTMESDIVECRELTAKFTIDVIGTCAFGLQLNTLADENSEFRKMGKAVFASDWKKIIRDRIRDFAPWLYSLLGPVFTDQKMTNFFLNITRETVEYRKRHHIVKHDFIDLIMKLSDDPNQFGDIVLTDILLAAQLFAFFAAGYETSSTTMSNALYELAQHQNIQDKLRDDINRELAKCNGEITYEAIKSMKYLDMVLKETLRKYPPGAFLMRKSTEQYTFFGTKVTVPKGTSVLIPVFAIHRDSRIYPKPEVFDPERFTNEAIATRHPMNWLPFSDGPKKCIAAHFANYQSKVGLIKILQHYKIGVCDKTRIPYVINPEVFILAPAHDIYVKITKIH